MHMHDVKRTVEISAKKALYLDRSGVYLGFGITLIFSIGVPFEIARPYG